MKLCGCKHWFRWEGDECTATAPGEVERELYEDDGGVAVANAGT